MTREADNPMTGSDFDWMVSNHAVWGWKAPVKASVSGVSFLHLSSFFASIFPLFPRNAWYSGYHMAATLGRVQEIKQKEGGRRGGVNINRHCKDPKIVPYFLSLSSWKISVFWFPHYMQRSLRVLTPHSGFKGLSQGRISQNLNDWVKRRDKKSESCCPRK